MEFTDLLNSSMDIFLVLLPIAVPIILLIILIDLWKDYVREKYILNQESVLLKVVPPTDIQKTPLAMELFINALHQIKGGEDFGEVYIEGSVRPWFSLELVSNEGKLNFFIWTPKSMVRYLESQIYSQYPGIEVVQVEDYAANFDFDHSKHKMAVFEYEFTQDNSIPIKTYVDYGLDKPSEDEEKSDPITPTLEFLGSANEGERIWIQILVRGHRKEDPKPGTWFGKTDLWTDNYQKEVQKIRKQYEEKDDEKTNKPSLTKIQESRIEAIERSQGKLPFDVGIRGIYIADKDVFDPMNKGALVGAFKQYSSANLNGFKPGLKNKIEHKWQDPFGKKIKALEKQFLSDYKEREYFHKTSIMGKKRKIMVMNSEELATMFHFPGSVAMTPSLERVQSRKSDAPSDLPR